MVCLIEREINGEKLKKLNKEFKRKRMINIFIIQKILESKGIEAHKKINLNLSKNTLIFYEVWWKKCNAIINGKLLKGIKLFILLK